MTKGLWLDNNTFVDFGELASRKDSKSGAYLVGEIASRQTAWDFSGLIGLLPDPDPVLLKRGDGPEVLDSLLSDGHLISVVLTRKLGTLKREFKWEPGTVAGQEATPQADALRDNLVEDLEQIDVYNLISTILDAPLFGLTPIEIKWAPGKGRLQIKDLEDKPNRWFGFDEQNQPRFISANNQWEGEEIPFGKFVFARHFPTYDNPYGLRLLSRCFWPIIFKRGGIKFWVTFAEKYGMPFMFGRYPRGATTEEQTTLLANLASMIQDAVAIGPEGSTVEMLGGGSDSKGSGDLYNQLKGAMDSEVSKVIMGQTLTAEIGDKGSYGASKTHENVLEDYREADQKLVKKVMGEIGRIYGQVNAPGVPAPVFKWFEDEDAQKEFTERDKTLSETGVKFTKIYYTRRYNLKDDEFELTKPEDKDIPPTKEKPSPGKSDDFAEQGGFGPNQQAIEDLADAALAAVITATGANTLRGNEELFVKIVREAGNYEDLIEKLLEIYPNLEMDGLVAAVESATLNAGLFGRMTVQEELDGD